MADEDLYAFLMDDEPTAQARSVALTEALRRKRGAADAHRGMGMLTSMGNNSLLGGLSKTSMASADQLGNDAARQEHTLAQVGQHRLSRALAAQKAAADVAAQGQQQAFTAGESEKARGATAEQHRLQRALQRELADKAAGAAKTKAEKDAADGLGKLTMDLRKEFDGLPEVRKFKDVSVAFEKVKGASESASAAGDMSLIYGYITLLDPGSSVKEGESAQAGQTTGVPGQILNLYNKALNGEILNPEQRAAFTKEAAKLYGAHQRQVAPVVARYRERAQRAGIGPDDVAIPVPEADAFAGKTVAPGSMELPAKGKRVRGPDGRTGIWDGVSKLPPGVEVIDG